MLNTTRLSFYTSKLHIITKMKSLYSACQVAFKAFLFEEDRLHCIITHIVLNMMFTITRDLVVPWHDLDLCPPLTQTPDLVVLDSTVHGYNG